MKQQDKITIFVERLKQVGVEVKCSGNYPWIYISYINGKRVTETFQGNHGFTLAFLPIKKEQEIEFTDITEIFKLIRKYCTKPKKMSWNHRIIKTRDGEDDWYQIHEVHYDENEEIVGHTERGTIVGGNTLEDIKWNLEKMLESLNKEVINQNIEDE